MRMKSQGQGAFEYVLLLAGILLMAVIAILILRSNVFPAANAQINNNTQVYRNLACLKTWEQDTSHVVGLWHLDEGTGTSATDSSGSGNAGVLSGSPAWLTSSSCQSGSCLAFNGVSQSVNISDSASLAFGNGVTDSPFTLSYWLKKNSAGDMGAVGKDAGSQREWQLTAFNDGKLHGAVYTGGAGGIPRISRTAPTAAITTGSWYHLAMTYDGSKTSAGIALYIDGIRADNANDNSGAYTGLADTAAPLFFNLIPGNGASSYYQASLDDVAIYNRALAPNEVLADYQCNG